MLANILYGLVIFIHVTASIVLILVILLQAGRGGGLSESFGGSSTQTIFGTKTNVFMTRATAVSAIVYLSTCLALAVMTAHRGSSIVTKGRPAPITQGKAQGGGAPAPLSPPDEF